MITEESRGRRIDRIWLGLLMIAGSALSTILATSIFDTTVFFSGILCVGLIAIGRREGYLIGLYNSISYAILAYGNGLYGEVYLNLLFFIPTGVIGYVIWRCHTMQDKTVAMRQLGWLQRFTIVAVCIACTIGLGVLLTLNPSQNTPCTSGIRRPDHEGVLHGCALDRQDDPRTGHGRTAQYRVDV